MERSLGNVVDLAEQRNIYLPDLIKDPFVPQDPNKTAETIRMIKGSISSIEIRGIHHLLRAETLARKRSLEVISNHVNEWDTVVTKIALNAAGVNTFGNRLSYYGGLQMYERAELRQFISTDNLLFVVAPADIDEVSQALKNPALTPEQASVLKECDRKQKDLIRATRDRAKDLFIPGAENPVLAYFPETDYQRGKGIIRPPRTVSALFSRDQGKYVLPIMITGHEDLDSQEESPKRIHLRLLIGKPYESALLWRSRRAAGVLPGDLAMASILSLDPSQANPLAENYFAPLLRAA